MGSRRWTTSACLPPLLRLNLSAGDLSAGDTIEMAAWRAGATQGIDSEWLAQRNEFGPAGLILRFRGSWLPELTDQESRDLQKLIKEGQL